MNIREIEEELGIPRANIRFYEKEGLLHPQRKENNYRDYSSDDLQTLKKIKLLRELDMPVETIRAVQAGEVLLTDALGHQEQLLGHEAVRLERNQAICRSMLSDRVTYSALEPQKYENLSLPERQTSRYQSPPVRKPPVEGAVWAYSPWQRFWARSLDLSLAGLFVAAVLAYLFHTSTVTSPGAFFSFAETLLIWVVVALVEPLLLSTWGTTPGKWLMGLELRDYWGKKLSYGAGLQRVGSVFGQAYGLEIPFYNFYRYRKAYLICKNNDEMPYDAEEDHLYYSIIGDRWFARAAVSLLLIFVLMAPLHTFLSYEVLVPPHRGDVTQAEYFENVNYLVEKVGSTELWLDEEGRELAKWNGTVSYAGGPSVDYLYGEPIPNAPIYAVETNDEGFVTAVTLTQEETVSIGGTPVVLNAKMLAMAFQGAERFGWQIAHSKLSKRMDALDFADALWDRRNGGTVTCVDGPYTLTAQLECEGFTTMINGNLFAPDGLTDEGWFRFTMRLEKGS